MRVKNLISPSSTFFPFSSMKVLITPLLFCFLPSFWPTASLPLSPSHHCFQLFLLCSPSSLYPVLILKDLNIQIRLIAKLFNPTTPCFIDESLTSEWNASIVHLQEVYLKSWLIDFSVKCYIWSFFFLKKKQKHFKIALKKKWVSLGKSHGSFAQHIFASGRSLPSLLKGFPEANAEVLKPWTAAPQFILVWVRSFIDIHEYMKLT